MNIMRIPNGITNAVVLFAILVTSCGVLNAQVSEADAQDRSSEDSTSAGGTSVIPFPFIFYTPETKTGFGGTVITMFRVNDQDQPSTVSPIFIYTQKKQIVAMLTGELFLDGGRYRMNGELGYSKFPNTLWGVGNDTPESLEEDYTPRLFYTNLQLQRRVVSGWFVGGRFEFANRRLVETDSLGLLVVGGVPGTDDGRIVSGGVLVTWDTRDNTIYPRVGGYRQAKILVSDPAFGSDYGFRRYTIDVREYVTLAPEHILAIRGYGIASNGTQPFDVMPQVGGESLLRGYYQGRFRDQNLLALQVEYRTRVWWRIGAVGFASAGRVAQSLGELSLDGFKPSAGFGLRFLLAPDEGLNLRADFGFGQGSSGFYLGMGEVF